MNIDYWDWDYIAFLPEASMSIKQSRRHEAPDPRQKSKWANIGGKLQSKWAKFPGRKANKHPPGTSSGGKFWSDLNWCEPQVEMRRLAEPQAAHLEDFWAKNLVDFFVVVFGLMPIEENRWLSLRVPPGHLRVKVQLVDHVHNEVRKVTFRKPLLHIRRQE